MQIVQRSLLQLLLQVGDNGIQVSSVFNSAREDYYGAGLIREPGSIHSSVVAHLGSWR
jgi:hypothetical protein